MTRPVPRLLRTLLAACLVLALCLAPAAPVLGANHASGPVREQPRQTISASNIFAAVDAEGGLWVWGYPFRRYNSVSETGKYYNRTPQKILDGVVFVDTCSRAVAAIRADGSLLMGYSDMLGNGGQGTYTTLRYHYTIQSAPIKLMDNVSAVSLSEEKVSFY